MSQTLMRHHRCRENWKAWMGTLYTRFVLAPDGAHVVAVLRMTKFMNYAHPYAPVFYINRKWYLRTGFDVEHAQTIKSNSAN